MEDRSSQQVIWKELGHPPEPVKKNGWNKKPGGYAAMPGTGPESETCGSCRWRVYKTMGNRYQKCFLMKRHWTGGSGTDIKARSPSCREWEKMPQGRKKPLSDFETENI